MTRKPRILLIEDDPADVTLFQYALRGVPDGYELHVAEDGPDGLEKVRELRPDLIFLDLFLPTLPGEDVCKRIRTDRDEDIARIPIVMLSAKSTDADRVVGKVIGANTYLTKPCEAEKIVQEIKRLIPHGYLA